MSAGGQASPEDGIKLHGRYAECRTLTDSLESARSRSVVMVVEGEPGAGKSALCRFTAQRALALGMRVVSVAGVEGESDLPVAGLSSVLRPLASNAQQLPSAQRRAALVAAGLSDDAVLDRFTLAAAALGVLASAAESAPLLLVLDDCHWLDEASLDALAFALRRLDADAVMALIAVRSGQCPDPFTGIGQLLPVSGLIPAALAAVLADAGLQLHPTVLDVVADAVDGLPLPALETVAALSADQRCGRAALPDPLPVGRGVAAAYRKALDALPARAHRALAVAVVAGSAPHDVMAAALDDLGLSVEDLEPAEDAGVLSVTPQGTVFFTHPLARAGAFGVLSPSARRQAHRALAEATRHDPERRSRHLLGAATAPSEEVAAAAEQAAWAWRRRGICAAAAFMFVEAARATPPDCHRDARVLAAAETFAQVGLLANAQHHAQDVLATATEPALRGAAHAVVVASSLWTSGTDAAVEAINEARRIAESDPITAARVLVLISAAATSRGALPTALATAREAFELAGAHDGAPEAREVLAMTLVLSGRHAEGRRLLAHGLTRPDQTSMSLLDGLRFPTIVQTLVRLELLDDAHRLLHELLDICGQRSAPSALAYIQGCACELLWWRGQWAEALSAGEEALVLATETGQEVLGGYTAATLARVLAARGDEEACRQHVTLALKGRPELDTDPVPLYGRSALGLLELGLGNTAAAASHLRAAARIARACHGRDPRAVPFAPDLVEALVRENDFDAARRESADYTAMAKASGTEWALATSCRAQALILGDEPGADALFAQAIQHHEASDAPFDEARTRLYWGEYRRRRKDVTGSRQLLRAAHEAFHALGARHWVARAATELRAAGARPEHQPPTELTELSPQELRCALAVADGLSNREAATRLFLSPRTVEYHLGKAFTKLGVTSRVQLARLVERNRRSIASPVPENDPSMPHE